MYLRGSKWSMQRRRKRTHPFLMAMLVILIATFFYLDRVVVPQTGPLFIPSPTPTRDPASFIAEGQTAFTAGKIAKAIEAYKQAVQANGTDVSTYITLAQMELYNHAYTDALSNAGNALLLAPNNATALAIKGYAQYSLADFTGAEVTLKNAIETDPNNPLGHAFYAEFIANEVVERNQVRALGINEAIDEAHKAIDLGQNTIEAHKSYGFVLFETQNYEQAIEQYQAGIDINKNIADLYIGLGQCYEAKPETQDQAVEAYLKAIPLNPTDAAPNIYLARVYYKLGQYPMAIQYAELGVKADPTNPVRYGALGYYLKHNNQGDQAVTALELFVKGGMSSDGQVIKGVPLSRDPTISLYYAAYGIVLANLGRCSEALPVSQMLLNGLPDDENAVFNANTIIDTCKQNLEGTYTPTPEPGGTPTPAP
jgi:tetratricopeptide (TPR) repeat protein